MPKKITYRGPVIALSEAVDGDIIEIQVLKTGTFFDPRYGKFTITRKLFSEMISNFKKNTIKKEVSLDYIHAAEDKAAAWFKDLYEKDVDGVSGLFAKVELTGSGKCSLSEKDFKYVSADFDPKWKDNEKGEVHGCVLEGAALTNRPVIKGMQSIQLSEVEVKEGEDSNDDIPYDEMKKQFTELQTKYSELEKKSQGANTNLPNPLEGEPMTPEEKKLMEDKDAEILALKKGQGDLEEKVQLSEKNSKFDKMLVTGKAVEAQRKAYIEGDMEKFADLSVKIKLSEDGTEAGHKKVATDGDADKADVEDEIAVEANKLVLSEKIRLSDAIKRVSSQPKFAKALAGKFE